MENHYFSLIRKSWKYAEGRKKQFILTYVLFAFANLSYMVEPIFLGMFFNTIQAGGENAFKDSLILLGLYASLTLFFWGFHGTGRIIERMNTFYITRTFREKLFKMISFLPIKWHKNNHSGNVMSRVEKASDALKGFVEEGFMYIETFINFFLSLGAIFYFLPTSGFTALAFGSAIMFIIARFDKVLVKYFRAINEKWHIYDSTFYDYITNIRTVITLRLESLAKNETIQKINDIFPIWKKNTYLNEAKWLILSIALTMLNFGVIFFFLLQKFSANETIMIGTLVALYQYTQRFRNVFFEIAWKWEQLIRFNTDLKSVESIENAYKKMKLEKKPSNNIKDFSTIQIKNMYFRYEDEQNKKHNLENINIEIKKGEKIALVGESGGGKSTIMSLIRGLDETDRITIKIDEKTFKYSKALANLVTLIPQDPEIFDNTVEYNICAGLSHNKEEILEAIKTACFEKVLHRLPNGLKTNIKERGVNLSGGEKQRLALARGVFAAKHSKIILLDEPTSSVDSKNELKIYENLFAKFKDYSIISSVHRLHLLPKFDTIYMFKNGKILARGNFKTLLVTNAELKSMWEAYKKQGK